jgi:hypothetical protein
MLNVVLCRAAAIVSCGVLVGCGSTTPLSPIDQYGVYYDQYTAIDAQNTSANFTPENAMPSSGSVAYDGVSFVTYTANGEETGLLGDATIRANFGTDTMTGSFTNFVGGPNIGTSTEEVSAFGGDLSMTGEIGTVTAGCNACFAGQMSGTLTGSGDTIRINSPILGGFFGAGHELIGGFTTASTISVNDVPVTGGAKFVAER